MSAAMTPEARSERHAGSGFVLVAGLRRRLSINLRKTVFWRRDKGGNTRRVAQGNQSLRGEASFVATQAPEIAAISCATGISARPRE